MNPLVLTVAGDLGMGRCEGEGVLVKQKLIRLPFWVPSIFMSTPV